MSFNLLPDDLKHKILWMSIHSELSEYAHIHSERISIGCLDHNNADEDYWRPPMWKKLEWSERHFLPRPTPGAWEDRS